jgi:uncharacterized protein YbjT (DUF2867 family)
VFLVTGSTGNAGRAVVGALARDGHLVRALVRNGSDQTIWPPGVEPALGDLNRPESLRGAPLEGVRAVFLLSGYQQLEETLTEMRRAGVERVVLLSSSAAPGGDLSNTVARYHILSERAVRDSGLAWTFLQPNSFMSNTFRWKAQLRGDVVRLPFANVRIATIDPDDLGAVAAIALVSGEHDGRTYRLSGPESLLPADQVRILAKVLGRDLRFEGQSDDEARSELSARMPAEYVEAFFRFFVDGDLDESQVLPTVEEITGRKPRTYEQWARAHTEALSG